MSSDDLQKKIATAVAHAPDWLRQELASKDPTVRARAEETLAAMISAALNERK